MLLDQKILDTPNLLSFWDFSSGSLRARGPADIELEERGGAVPLVQEGVFGPHSLRFGARGIASSGYLTAPRQGAEALCLGGSGAEVTVLAWVKRLPSEYSGCEFVAGVWNEHHLRQYGLFLNLGIWSSRQQVCAHVSTHGGPTPGFPYCMDAAIGATPLTWDTWHCVGMTYDCKWAQAWLNGVVDIREPQGQPGRNPFHYPGSLFQGTADFTVGAVARPNQVLEDGQGGYVEVGSLVANPFCGLLGGLAIFDRALTPHEMQDLAARPQSVSL